MKKAMAISIILVVSTVGYASRTATVNGITWTYEPSGYASIYNYQSGVGYRSVIPTTTTGAITVPSTLGGSPVKSIGKYAFLDCSGITDITIPDSITDIDDSAFSGCDGLADEDGFVIIRSKLYSYVGSSSDVIVPNTVAIGDFAFYDCDTLENVIISEGIKSIGDHSFSGCKGLAQVTIPNSVTNVGATAFSDCDELKRATISQHVCLRTVVEIFPSITNVVVADGVSTIGAESFSGCESLQSITLPPSVTSIRAKAFKDCINLKVVHFLGNAPDAEEDIFQGTPRTLTVQVEKGSIGWSGGVSSVLPSSWCDRAIMYADGTGGSGAGPTDPILPVITNFVYTTVTNEVHHYSTGTNYIYSTVTNYVFSTVTNEVFHYLTVTNEVHHYTTVTNVVKYVPEPGASPDAGYGINVGAGGETVIAGAAGWDAFGVPDGMEWNKETGTLSGRAKLSGAYDLILVSGSGADTKIMRTTLTVAPYDTIIGYVGVAFSQSGAPLDNLKSYKTLPAGLKWKSGKLSGVPTKKQTLQLATKDGEPVTIEIRALPTAAVGAFSGAVTVGGGGATALPDDDGHAGRVTLPVGRVTLNVTSAGKISGKVYEGGRTWTLSAANFSSASVPTNGEFRVSGTATRTASKKTYKQPWTLVIAVDGGRGATALPGATIVTGTFGDTMTFEAQRNFWKDDGAGELIADWVGEYAWTAPDGGKLTLALNAAGTVKVTGKLGNGRALSLSFPLAYQDGERKLLIYAAPQTVKVKSGKKTENKKYLEFIAVVKLVNEPGMSEAGGDIAYRYR